jgi:hypothetical protein
MRKQKPGIEPETEDCLFSEEEFDASASQAHAGEETE